jgi:raffinose/stachyose/melibiose transport system substrate-binding protein
MLLQGVWAIPNILKANPNMKVGSFVLPASNDPAQNKLVSGVDVVLTMAKQTKHQQEAQAFIDFLLKPENAKQFIDEQKAFSAVKGVNQEDPNVAELKPAFDNGQLVDFFDHYVPSAMKLENLVQELDMKQDADAFLTKMDKEWDKVQARK